MKKTKRGYRLGQREEAMAETRGRIVAAIVALHEEIGPRRTTIKGIAERAGVERLTVYRHFPDDRALYEACSSCWLESHPPPDPAQWREEADVEKRTRSALLSLNKYFSAGSKMLRQIYRDMEDIPELGAVTKGFTGYLEGIRRDLSSHWLKERKRSSRSVETTIAHVLNFQTWDSLDKEGLDDVDKTAMELAWIRSVADTRDKTRPSA